MQKQLFLKVAKCVSFVIITCFLTLYSIQRKGKEKKGRIYLFSFNYVQCDGALYLSGDLLNNTLLV